MTATSTDDIKVNHHIRQIDLGLQLQSTTLNLLHRNGYVDTFCVLLITGMSHFSLMLLNSIPSSSTPKIIFLLISLASQIFPMDGGSISTSSFVLYIYQKRKLNSSSSEMKEVYKPFCPSSFCEVASRECEWFPWTQPPSEERH